MNRTPVLHIIDSLNNGGAERVAVNIVNGLVGGIYEPHLCVTRQMGPLNSEVSSAVNVLCLNRKHLFDIRAIRECFRYLGSNNIRLIHAHSSSVFFALLLKLFAPHVLVLWHVHRGEDIRYVTIWENLFYRWAAWRSSGIICVSLKLKEWIAAMSPRHRIVRYLPNFIFSTDISSASNDVLPGEKDWRVICVSNLKSQKDHFTLLEAWKQVMKQYPQAYLILVGDIIDQEYADKVLDHLRAPVFKGQVVWLGVRPDVRSLLNQGQIGVLSSRSEGFPVALLEYGLAKLGVVTTNVGQCSEILDHGNAGYLVPPSNPVALADALGTLLGNTSKRKKIGARLYEHVSTNYSSKGVLNSLAGVYLELMTMQTRKN